MNTSTTIIRRVQVLQVCLRDKGGNIVVKTGTGRYKGVEFMVHKNAGYFQKTVSFISYEADW